MNYPKNSPIMGTHRKGQQDMWNAFMVKGAKFSSNDIPLCPTTALSVPSELISYDAAKTIHRKELKRGNTDYHVNAFIHFYIDDQKFDGKRSSIWLYPENALSIIRHFYRMNAFGFWVAEQGIPVISNARWGTKETWPYCFDANPLNSMLAIGTVGSGLRLLKNRALFEEGLFQMNEVLHPHTLIVYGSSRYKCFDVLRDQGVQIISFPSKTTEAFVRRDQDE